MPLAVLIPRRLVVLLRVRLPLRVLLLLREEGRRAEALLERLERLLDLRRRERKLPHDPEARAAHATGPDREEAVQHLPQDLIAQLRVRLGDLPDEHGDVERRPGVGVAEKVHEQVDDCAGDAGEANRASVHSLHEHLAVLASLLAGVRLRLLDLLLERRHHLVDVAAGDEVEDDVERLFANVHVWGGDGAKDVHDHLLHDVPVRVLELRDAIQDDELDVVVGLRHQQLAVAVAGSLDRGGRG